MNPPVSILIPCFNAERWIALAIESALAQTWPEKEVIVVDDGSTDGSLNIIKRFGNRIRWETGPNRGGNVARNRLLQLARGEWLQYLDADDYLLPGKITGQVQFLREHPDVDIQFSEFMFEHWTATGSSIEITRLAATNDIWVLLARWLLPGTGSGLWRRQAILDAGGWNEQQPCCQEHELYLRLLMAGKRFRYCPDGGYVYRQWSDGTVCKRDKSEVHRRRMEIMRRGEDFLRERNELSPGRQREFNQGYFEIARQAWLYDQRFAVEIIKSIKRSQPDFVPAGKTAPYSYRLLWRLLGFRLTETIADWRRSPTAN